MTTKMGMEKEKEKYKEGVGLTFKWERKNKIEK